MVKFHENRLDSILEHIRANPGVSSGELFEALGNTRAYATLKRELQFLRNAHLLTTTGKGKATRYAVSDSFELLHPVDVNAYYDVEVDQRKIRNTFNHELITGSLRVSSVFSPMEMMRLIELQEEFQLKTKQLTEKEYAQEMERLAIDLSWKSSQIEGNTYSLLETERLLKEKEETVGKPKDDATMLLNHKAALDFIVANPSYVSPLNIAVIEDIHSLLIKDLGVPKNLRRRSVGISGTNYRPPENEFLIREAMQQMCDLVNAQDNPFSAALLLLVLISYIQPFADGNKRTARIISNAMLINKGYCPLSFRTVNSIDYKKAILIFYEQNNITAFKQIFIEQFQFAVKTYF